MSVDCVDKYPTMRTLASAQDWHEFKEPALVFEMELFPIAVSYAKIFSRSHPIVIHVFDEVGDCNAPTHWDFKEW